jgi:hypothetical protein
MAATGAGLQCCSHAYDWWMIQQLCSPLDSQSSNAVLCGGTVTEATEVHDTAAPVSPWSCKASSLCHHRSVLQLCCNMGHSSQGNMSQLWQSECEEQWGRAETLHITATQRPACTSACDHCSCTTRHIGLPTNLHTPCVSAPCMWHPLLEFIAVAEGSCSAQGKGASAKYTVKVHQAALPSTAGDQPPCQWNLSGLVPSIGHARHSKGQARLSRINFHRFCCHTAAVVLTGTGFFPVLLAHAAVKANWIATLMPSSGHCRTHLAQQMGSRVNVFLSLCRKCHS